MLPFVGWLFSSRWPYTCECSAKRINLSVLLNKRWGHEVGRGACNIGRLEVKLMKELECEIPKEWEKYITIEWTPHYKIKFSHFCLCKDEMPYMRTKANLNEYLKVLLYYTQNQNETCRTFISFTFWNCNIITSFPLSFLPSRESHITLLALLQIYVLIFH